ncbi:MAG: hypothetical protein ACAI44_32970 [Candidatus Sericytochromatia bacterium]
MNMSVGNLAQPRPLIATPPPGAPPRPVATPPAQLPRVSELKAVNLGLVARNKSGEALKSAVRTSEKIERLNNRLSELKGEHIRENSVGLGKKIANFFNFRQDSFGQFAKDVGKATGAYLGKNLVTVGKILSQVVAHTVLLTGNVVAAGVGVVANAGLLVAQLGTGIYSLGVGIAKLCSMASQKMGRAGFPRVDAHWDRVMQAQVTLAKAHVEVHRGPQVALLEAHKATYKKIGAAALFLEKKMGLLQDQDGAVSGALHKGEALASGIKAANTGLKHLDKVGLAAVDLGQKASGVGTGLANGNLTGGAGVALEGVTLLVDAKSQIGIQMRLNRIEDFQKDPKAQVLRTLNQELEALPARLEKVDQELASMSPGKKSDKLQAVRQSLLTRQQQLPQEIAAITQANSSQEIQDAMGLLQKNQKQARNHKTVEMYKKVVMVAATIGAAVALGVTLAAVGATPVGWGLAGAAIGAAIGFGVYKAYKAMTRVRNVERLTETAQNAKVQLESTSRGLVGLQDLHQTRQQIGNLKRTDPQSQALPGLERKAQTLEQQCRQVLAAETPLLENLIQERQSLKQEVEALHVESQGILTPAQSTKLQSLQNRLAEITDYLGPNPRVPLSTEHLDDALQFFGKKTRVSEDLAIEASSYLNQSSPIASARLLVQALKAEVPEPAGGPAALKVLAARAEARHVLQNIVGGGTFKSINVDALIQGDEKALADLQQRLGLFYS